MEKVLGEGRKTLSLAETLFRRHQGNIVLVGKGKVISTHRKKGESPAQKKAQSHQKTTRSLMKRKGVEPLSSDLKQNRPRVEN